MTKREKEHFLQKESIAYYSGCNGIEIKDFEHGIDDYVIFCANAWYSDSKGKKNTVHRAKVYTNNRHSYFRYNGYTIPLDECIRMGI